MFDNIIAYFTEQSVAELLAVLFSLAYVHYAAKQNRACWPFAFLSTGLYIGIFWETTLFFQSLLNVWYLIMAVYGWINWRRIEQQNEVVKVWSVTANMMTVASLTLVSMLLYQVLDFLVVQQLQFLDLAIAVFSAFVTYMLAQKVLENWLYWIVINSVAIWLYWEQGLYATGVLFVLYIGYAIKGYLNWQKHKGLILPEG